MKSTAIFLLTVGSMAFCQGLSQDELATLEKVTEGTNQFSISLFRGVSKKKEGGNVFVSPVTAQIVLALAYTGARGNTAQELATLLTLPDKLEDTYVGYNSLIKVLQDPVVNIATRMFMASSLQVKEEFQQNAQKYFLSTVEALDFAANPEKSRAHINTWVEEQTKQKIHELLKPKMIDSATRLVLVNAIHFKANWNLKFNESATKPRLFHLSKSKSIDVLMMNDYRDGGFSYDYELKAKILELEYEGGNFRMVVILPDDIEGLADLETKLDSVKLADKLKHLPQTKLHISLPKFRLEETLDLNDILKSMGANTMFSANANFSGLSKEHLAVSKVVQKAFVEVNEEGTEAAAASAVIFAPGSAGPGAPQYIPPEFIADHPFFFMIMYKNTTLFVGKVAELPPVAH